MLEKKIVVSRYRIVPSAHFHSMIGDFGLLSRLQINKYLIALVISLCVCLITLSTRNSEPTVMFLPVVAEEVLFWF
jgi:hypothetical protein